MRNIDIPVWSNDGTKVCYKGRPIRGADPKTFEVLLGNYARDARNVFFHSSKFPADRATFRVLNANFGVDANCAYFVISPIKDADPKTFRVLDSSLVHGSSTTSRFLASGYAADANSVWFASGEGVYRLKTADPKTFISLGNSFGCDSERVFFERAIIPDADRATWRLWREYHSVDKENVFFTNKKISGVDRASIRLLTAGGCFMDRHRIYCNAEVISSERYLEFLKYCVDACAREQEYVPSGKIFEWVLDEGQQVI